jgi:hypothetical protein
MEWIFDNIVQYLKDGNWDTATQLMGAICHFTGDATMPLHATYDYNPGGNHVAYEGTVNSHLDEISIPDNYVPQELDNVFDAAMATLEESFSFTREGCNGGVNLTDFLENNILWNDWIKSMAENRLRTAAQFSANVWYSAMIQAGLTIQAPTLISPANDLATINNTLTFTWTSIDGASSYDLQLVSDNDFTAGTLTVKGLSTTSYTLVEPLAGGEYYWRVRTGDNSTDVGLWSQTRRVIVLTPNFEVAILPSYHNGMPGATLEYNLTVRNIGILKDNYYLTISDDAGWSLILSDNLLENVQLGENRAVTLSVTVPEDVTYYIQDNITVTVISAENTEISKSSVCNATAVMALLSPPHSDYGVDTDNDNLYNYLVVDVNVAVAEAGWYQISGNLYDTAYSNWIAYTSAENYLDVGTQTIELLFDGRPINRSKRDGQYLADLCLQDEWGNLLDNGEHETQPYSHENFQYFAKFSPPHSDYGLDTDGDNLYNYLVVEANVVVSAAGWYRISSDLYDNTCYRIASVSAEDYLDVGTQTLELRFDGRMIHYSGRDGPYRVSMSLYDNWKNWLDSGEHITVAYTSIQFQIAMYSQLLPTDDAHVIQAYPYSNYGYRTYLYVGRYYGGAERSFLKFDISEIPEGATIVEARYWDYCWSVSYGGANVQVQAVEDDAWYEYNITWNYQPTLGPVLDGPYQVGGSQQWYSWGITNFVAEQLAGDKIVSICMVDIGENSGGQYSGFESKEWGYPHPYLEITYIPPPYAVNVSISPRSGSGLPGDTLTYSVTVKNTGFLDDNYELTVMDTAGWNPMISTTFVTLQSGQAGNATLAVSIPENVPFSVDYITVTATSQSNTDVRNSNEVEAIAFPAKLAPTHSDYGLDTDNDNLYDYLVVEVNVEVSTAGWYQIQSVLYDHNYNYIQNAYAYAENYLEAGTQTIELRFRGGGINHSGMDGPYLAYLWLYDEWWNWLDSDEYWTATYIHDQFQPPPAVLAPPHSDNVIDTDNDGFYNYLVVEANVSVTTSGWYYISSNLYGNNGNYITYASAGNYLDAGIQTLELRFDGLRVNRSGWDGPYQVYLWLYDSEYNWLDSGEYLTSAYTHDQFQPLPAKLAPPHSDYGLDTDNDNRYNYLVVDVNVDVATSGSYCISSSLYDNNYNYITGVWVGNYLDVGTQTIELMFDGWRINRSGWDGPYYVYLYLYSYDYGWLDSGGYWTAAYTHENFQYLAKFSPPHSDNGLDIDNDGLYNYLMVEANVSVATAGWYSIGSYLYDNAGNYIADASAWNYLEMGTHEIELSFKGYEIERSGRDGPYRVSLSLYSYTYGWLDSGEHWTAAYTHDQFQLPPAKLNPPHSDYGLDTDNDNLYNYLIVEANVSVTTAGWFNIYGDLYDNLGHWIISASADNYLDVGIQTIDLRFSGDKINRAGWDGPYRVYLSLYDNGNWLDSGEHWTAPYTYDQFQPPPPPVATYIKSNPPYEWTPRVSTTDVANGDDVGTWVTLPFEFPFWGEPKTRVWVSSNGLLMFDPSYPSNWSSFGSWMIAPFSCDLRTDYAGGIVSDPGVYVDEYADNVVITWEVTRYGNSSDSIKFQVILYSNGNIRINIDNATNFLNFYPTMGISSGDGAWYFDITGEKENNRSWLFRSTPAMYIEKVNPGTTVVDARNDTDTMVTITTNQAGSVTVVKYENNPGGSPPSGFTALGKYIEVRTNIPSENIVWPIEIRIYYTDEEVAAAGIPENNLKIFYWDGSNWVQEPDSGVNTENNYVWARVTHLSLFAPMAEVNVQPLPPSPSHPTHPPARDTTPPPTPSLISPANGSTTTDATPILDWSDASDTSGVTYSLSIAKDPGFVSIVLEKSGLMFSTYELTSGEALPAGTYYWRVRAVDGAGNVGSWSENWSFTVSVVPTSVVTPPISLAIPIGIAVIAIIAIGAAIIIKRHKPRRSFKSS